MKNNSDILEIALNQALIRSTTKLEDQQQLVCYFYVGKDPYYFLMLTPFEDIYTLYRLDDDVTFKLRGNLLDIEQSKDQFLALKYGRLLIPWLVNLRTAYIRVKTDYFLKEFLG